MLNKRKKGKVVLIHTTKVYNGSGGKAPLILNFGTRWRLVINNTPLLLYPRERTVVPIK
jgi:hypothetical protein